MTRQLYTGHCRPTRGHDSPRAILLGAMIAALCAGTLMPTQAQVNGSLSAALADPFSAALISFGTGFGILLFRLACSRAMRSGLARACVALRERRLPW